jgi:hypothetical protein
MFFFQIAFETIYYYLIQITMHSKCNKKMHLLAFIFTNQPDFVGLTKIFYFLELSLYLMEKKFHSRL